MIMYREGKKEGLLYSCSIIDSNGNNKLVVEGHRITEMKTRGLWALACGTYLVLRP